MWNHEAVRSQRNRVPDDRLELSRDGVGVTPLGDPTFLITYPDSTTQRIHPSRGRRQIAWLPMLFRTPPEHVRPGSQ